MVVAVKFIDDSYYKNEDYAKLCGVSARELAALERAFLQSLDYRLHI